MNPGFPWALVVYGIIVVLLAAAMLGVAYFIGERHRERATGLPYESGMLPTGSARVRFPTDFYLVAMFFVIFDLETVFIVAWAVAVRPLGWAGYIAVTVFIGTLLVALGYLWRVGALMWESQQQALPATPARKGSEDNADYR